MAEATECQGAGLNWDALGARIARAAAMAAACHLQEQAERRSAAMSAAMPSRGRQEVLSRVAGETQVSD